jgi:hypothetical protein
MQAAPDDPPKPVNEQFMLAAFFNDAILGGTDGYWNCRLCPGDLRQLGNARTAGRAIERYDWPTGRVCIASERSLGTRQGCGSPSHSTGRGRRPANEPRGGRTPRSCTPTYAADIERQHVSPHGLRPVARTLHRVHGPTGEYRQHRTGCGAGAQTVAETRFFGPGRSGPCVRTNVRVLRENSSWRYKMDSEKPGFLR